MEVSKNLASHLRQVYFGGNWSTSNMESQLSDLSWEEATTSVLGTNSILKLSYHLHYYNVEISKVLKGAPLLAKDKYSFDHPEITTQEEWNQFRQQLLLDAESFAVLIEQIEEEKLIKDFSDKKYGNYFRNIFGIIEHVHYHLGQIAILKKLIRHPT